MNRVYELNLPLNSAQFTLYGPGGNGMVYNFTNGDVTHKVSAYYMTDDPYKQQLLESSEIFAQGKVKFDKQTARMVAAEEEQKRAEAAQAEAQTEDTAEEEPAPTETSVTPNNDVEIVAEVKSVTQAIQYVQEHYGIVARTATQAKKAAAEHNVMFPNLRVGK